MITGVQHMESLSETQTNELDYSTQDFDHTDFIAYLKGTGVSHQTIRVYCRWIEKITNFIGTRPDLWDANHLTQMMKEFSRSTPDRPHGYARATRMLIKAALRRYWESAGRSDLLAPGPFWQNGRGSSRHDYIKSHTAGTEEVERVLEE
jgi:hypothetical protein